MTPPNLRDTKRAATRVSLALAALQLAQDKGWDHFTIDDVVAEAGYSRRTFANHFACKEEAVVAAAFIGIDDLDHLAQGLPERLSISLLVQAIQHWPNPVEAPDPAPGVTPTMAEIVDGIEQIVLSPIMIEGLRAADRLSALIAANPSLFPFLLARKNEVVEQIYGLIARIDGIEMDVPAMAILLGAVIGALQPPHDLFGTFRSTTAPDDSFDHESHVRLIFGYLRHGFVD